MTTLSCIGYNRAMIRNAGVWVSIHAPSLDEEHLEGLSAEAWRKLLNVPQGHGYEVYEDARYPGAYTVFHVYPSGLSKRYTVRVYKMSNALAGFDSECDCPEFMRDKRRLVNWCKHQLLVFAAYRGENAEQVKHLLELLG